MRRPDEPGADRVPWAVRLAIRLLPRRFRKRHGADLLAYHREARRAAGTPLHWIAATGDIAWTALVMRARAAVTAAAGTDAGGWAAALRRALRGVAREPGYSAMVGLSLALGIGVNAALFAVVDGVLLSPLPYDRPEELVGIWTRYEPVSGYDFDKAAIDPRELVDYRDANHTLAGVFGYATTARTLTGEGEPERVPAVYTTAAIFDVLGARMAVGRPQRRADDDVDAPPVAVLSHAFWTRRFGADSSIVGRTLALNGTPTEIVGVAEEGFHFPSPEYGVWYAARIDEAGLVGRESHYLQAAGRLAEGVGLESARAELRAIMAGWQAEWPDLYTGHYVILEPMKDDVVGDVGRTLWLLMAAVGFVLLIVCVNVANLVVVRGQSRRDDHDLRRALGAGRARAVGPDIAHNVLLVGLGAAAGLALARGGLSVLVGREGLALPRPEAIGVDATVVLFTLALATAMALLFSIVPVLGVGRPASTRLGPSGPGARVIRGGRGRGALVALQVGSSVVLAIGAGLTLRSVGALLSEDLGFQVDDRAFASLSLPQATYAGPAEVRAFHRDLLARLRALPGVSSVSTTSHLPIADEQSTNDFELEGRERPGPGAPTWSAASVAVGPDYFTTMGIPVLRGRQIEEGDDVDAPFVAVVSKSFVDSFLADAADPLGARMRFGGDPAGREPWWTIVGVVGDVDAVGPGRVGKPIYYMARPQATVSASFMMRSAHVVVRTSSDAGAVLPEIRRAVRALDADLPLIRLRTLDDVLRGSVARERFLTSLLSLLAGLAVLLGAMGIYGVTAWVVGQRRREIGIRLALGADGGRVVGLVFHEGVTPVLVGILAGAVGALAGARLLESLLFGVSARDPVVYATVLLAMTAVGSVACALPAWRAARVDPRSALAAQ